VVGVLTAALLFLLGLALGIAVGMALQWTLDLRAEYRR
jgi:hypothetical protein